MILGAKGLNPHEPAHRWVNDLVTRPNMSMNEHESVMIIPRYANIGRIVGVRSTEQFVGIIHSFGGDPNII